MRFVKILQILNFINMQKRLVFIYETLCQMPVEIIKGDIFDIMKSFAPAKIKTFFTSDSKIQEIIQQLSQIYEVEVIRPEPFVQIANHDQFKRFFNYWNKAKKTAFLKNGRQDG